MGKYRTIFILPILLLNVIALTLTGNGHAVEQDWEYYSYSKDFHAYFSPKTIKCLPNSEVKVLEKVILTKNSIELLVELTNKYDKEKAKKYKKAHSKILNTGLNCNDRLYIIYQDITYDKDGSVIDISFFDNAKWQTIVPGTFKDRMLEVMCGYCNNEK